MRIFLNYEDFIYTQANDIYTGKGVSDIDILSPELIKNPVNHHDA